LKNNPLLIEKPQGANDMATLLKMHCKALVQKSYKKAKVEREFINFTSEVEQ